MSATIFRVLDFSENLGSRSVTFGKYPLHNMKLMHVTDSGRRYEGIGRYHFSCFGL